MAKAAGIEPVTIKPKSKDKVKVFSCDTVFYEFRAFLCNHYCRCIGIARGNCRHDGRIHDA